jgi:aminobenzoyl-glutamate utilization protein B
MRLLTTLLFSLILVASATAQKKSKDVIAALEAKQDKYAAIAMQIWNNPELGYLEENSSKLLQSTLSDAGFKIKTGIADIPTAFTAEFGSGYPVIAILGEFDALPGVSQKAIASSEAAVEGGAGHACGHHLFGTASAAASIAVKDWLETTGTKGTIRFYGTPAEEGGAGKVYISRAGALDDVDAVLHWHPSSQNGAGATSTLANQSAKFRFYGEASHAAASPERGRSALDAVESMNYMVNMLREHVPMETRIHYVITHGGEAPNVVPAFAEAFYYVRNPDVANVKTIFAKVVKAAEGAALGTNTEMKYEIIHGLYNVLPNETLARIMHKNLETVGGVKYSDKDTEFASEILKTYPNMKVSLESANEIAPFVVREKGTGGSTDVGDVSWLVPTAGMGAATWVPGTSAHTWQAVAAGGTAIGIKGMMVAAKTITLTAMDIFNDPDVTKKAKEELLKRRGADFVYEALIGDRNPPLDYRKKQ